MTRFWVSWWSTFDPLDVPFDNWVSGYRCNPDAIDPFSDDAWNSASICAVIDASSEDEVWEGIGKYYPDFEARFCEERDVDFTPGDRFPGEAGRTSLIHQTG